MLAVDVGEELVIMEEKTVERPVVFAFFYQTKEYVSTGNPTSALAGNGPILVNRISSDIQLSGSAFPPEYYIDEMELKIGCHGH